jgi:hypothetical protein
MTLKELADKLESLDVDVFASLLGLEYTHDDQPDQAKKMIIDALRFSDQHGLKAPRPPLDDADQIAASCRLLRRCVPGR